ncbi:MAG: hypothetical protein AAF628_32470 [Planctomycetota bacterium]
MTKLDQEARVTIKKLHARGVHNTAIAEMLGVTEGSVRYHLRRPAALVIGEPKSPAAELLAQNTVLLDQVGGHLCLLAVHPAGEDREEELERVGIGHRSRSRLGRPSP